MRWRPALFFFALTAAFCLMLLTAGTDYYGSPTYYRTSGAAATREERRLVSMVAPARADAATETPAGLAAPARTLDPQIKPNPPALFVPQGSDPVFERHERNRAARAGRAGTPPHLRLRHDENGWHREEVALVTAYCPCEKCCGTLSPGITSIGKNAWTPGLAADPVYLEYGTKVFVPGYGMSVVDDTGGAMRRHWRRDGLLHIDVRMTYHYEARQWGKRYDKVKIYVE